MQAVHSSYASLTDLPARNSAAANHWLSAAERRAWHRMSSTERRATWLAGRIVAKQLLGQCLAEQNHRQRQPAPAEIHIETRSTDPGHGQRPSIEVDGKPIGWALSIAHTARGVLSAVATEADVALGVDLVCCRERHTRGLQWCFTPAEQRWLASAPAYDRAPEQLWAMKEALYKACQRGEGFAPARIEVVPGTPARYPGIEATAAVRSLQSWRVDGHVAAMAIASHAQPAAANGNGRHHQNGH